MRPWKRPRPPVAADARPSASPGGSAWGTASATYAALDPLMGILSDRLRWRVGRLPFVRWGAPGLAALFAALWTVPALRPHHAFAAALVLSLLFSLAYTIVQVPYMALTPELAPDYDERTALSSYRVAFGTVASLLAVAVPPVVVLTVTPGSTLAGSAPGGWAVMGVLFGALTLFAYLVVARTVPEPAHPPQARPPARGLQDVRDAFRIAGYRELFASFVAITIGIMIVNSMLPFYLESALRIPGAQQTPVLGLLFGCAVAAFPLWNALSVRLGKRDALSLGLAVLVLGLLPLTLFAPAGRVGPTLLGLTVVAGCGLSAVMLLPWAMLPDVVEFDELASGRRREGVVAALFTFGQKLAGSVGVFANAIAASLFGYVAGASLQAPGTVAGLRWMTGPVAAAVFVVAIVLVRRFPITRAGHAAARAELASRRAPPDPDRTL
ncbi:MAG: MFS transporter [Deinococcales bacterium]